MTFHKPPTPEQLDHARRLIEDGASQREVQRTTGIARETLRKHFPGQGWTYREGGDFRALTKAADEQIRKATLSAPRPAVPETVLQELAALREASKGLVGNTPRDDPKRIASETFCALAAQTLKEYDISTNALSLKLGLSRSGLRLRLARHGHLKKPASQTAYIGTGIGSNTGKGKRSPIGAAATKK